ncbi:MAG: K(+)-transporting ATPase subunit C [Acidimicrobiia bacterium]
MRRQLLPAVRIVLVFTVLLGLAYPLLVTGVAQALFSDKADGSFVTVHGQKVGSSLLGQQFTEAKYLHPRPSAAGDGYDAMASGASNLGPTNPTLLADVRKAAVAYRRENGLPAGFAVPIDAVTSSGSGLDPGISVANAKLQAKRVAEARGLTVAQVQQVIDAHTNDRSLGFMGEQWVNVLETNLALDNLTQG